MYGFQSVAMTDANDQAGSFTNLGPLVRLTNIDNKEYIEHRQPAEPVESSFNFRANWIAPITGTGNVTFYAAGIVGNGGKSTAKDDPTDSVELTLREQDLTSVNNKSSGGIEIYPNPATNFITINATNSNIETVQIVNITGDVVVESRTNSNQVDVSHLPTGVYFVQLFSTKGVNSLKFVKTN